MPWPATIVAIEAAMTVRVSSIGRPVKRRTQLTVPLAMTRTAAVASRTRARTTRKARTSTARASTPASTDTMGCSSAQVISWSGVGSWLAGSTGSRQK